jgi:hypothetical protein
LVVDVKQSAYGLVVKPCGLKQDGKQEAISLLREEQKRRKEDENDPTYVPEVSPEKKNRNKNSGTASNKKSAGDCVFDVGFVFLHHVNSPII